ncbi:uncharacterized protein LOC128709417 [Anopheles marshallii]|uniref:uncharacterized protein LOC128709417 n=1 Tax=Anopheles marshallii TaxID=1521116 RepID=UPI00237A8D6E|nr:uncharacterized protein LOC128709417 [Anopheles marshallii]
MNIPVPEILNLPYSIEVPYFFLGDQAFAMKEYCLRTYGGMHPAESMERNFNYRHSRARRTVESAFGILAKVFRVLAKPIDLEPDIAEKVVLAVVTLHNFRRRHTLYNYSTKFLPPTTDTPSTSMEFEQFNEASPPSMLPFPVVALRPARALQNMRNHLARHFLLNDP